MTRIFDEDLKAAFGTRAIHAGQRPDLLSGAIMTPIYTTSTYVQEGLGQNKGYEYARGKNPTREALERNVAALEGGTHGFAFSSGMGATDSIMKLFKSGDHIIAGESSYGGTFRLFDKILRKFGLCFTYVDSRDPQNVEDACNEHTAAIMMETPTNPMMRITDLAAVGEIAKRKNALFIVDNTFASPYFQRPFDHGADIVYHKIAAWLAEKLGHENVIYPGLPSHPQHELAKRQMKGFGGMISVLTGSKEKAARVLSKVRVFSLAESLGGVESLISHPASMTHASVPAERRAALGLRDDLLRLSCGVEDIGDLIADLDQAFA
jgi:cystathionine beta-lyase/cystathionine gamma-synthase